MLRLGPPERRRQLVLEHSQRAVAVAALVRTAFAAHLPREALRGAGTGIAPPSAMETAQQCVRVHVRDFHTLCCAEPDRCPHTVVSKDIMQTVWWLP